MGERTAVALLNRTYSSTQPKAEAKAPSIPISAIVVAAAVAVVVIGLLQIMQTSRATTANFRIQQLEQQKLELDASVRQVEADVASLSSLGRVQREAQRMGLVPPSSSTTVTVNAPPPQAPAGHLPSRFAPQPHIEKGQQGSSWWQDLLKVLPFQ